jgi:poly-D-alanine transfer protein DltD
MKTQIFSVYDSKAEAYNTPMFVPTKGQAIRAFSDQVNEPGSELNKHPEDYTLFCLGEFDSDTGLITPLNSPHSIGGAHEFMKQ